jgi:hypothetical protein
MPRAIRFYTDEHIAKAIIRGLRRHGVDVLSVPDTGMFGATDDQHFVRAQAEGRVIISQDKDFLVIAAVNPGHAGIAFAAQSARIGAIIAGIVLIHQMLDPPDMIGRVEYL